MKKILIVISIVLLILLLGGLLFFNYVVGFSPVQFIKGLITEEGKSCSFGWKPHPCKSGYKCKYYDDIPIKTGEPIVMDRPSFGVCVKAN